MIVLQPIGNIDRNILRALRESLSLAYGRRVEIGDSIVLTEASWDQQRSQYQAEALLQALPSPAAPEDRVLGIVDADIYAPRLNFVFGQADISSRRAIISLWRLRQEFYGLPGDDRLFQGRVLTEAVHELGHTFGLDHCHRRKCVMHFSNSLHDTDVKSSGFCSGCARKVKKGVDQVASE